jgi:hypothetical protein
MAVIHEAEFPDVTLLIVLFGAVAAWVPYRATSLGFRDFYLNFVALLRIS